MTAASARPDLASAEVMRSCEIRFARRSGPGGQNRNKVETAVVLAHGPSGIVAEANERRSQQENREAALFRMRVALALHDRRTHTMDDSPSALWRSRIRGGRIAINPEHLDFPEILAEALDAVDASGFDVSKAAARLEVTGSQLVKLLKLEPKAMAMVNGARLTAGMHALK